MGVCLNCDAEASGKYCDTCRRIGKRGIGVGIALSFNIALLIFLLWWFIRQTT